MSEVKRIGSTPLGKGANKTAYLVEWRGQKVVQMELNEAEPHAREEMILAFREEFEFLRKLRHPNIVLLLAQCKRDGSPSPSFITEFCERASLHSLLRVAKSKSESKTQTPTADTLTVVRIWSILRDVARGLLYLHSQLKPVVHRDVKSPNVLLTRTYTAKLCDFGLARTQQHTAGLSTMNTNAGTLQFFAPEQSGMEDSKVTTAVDIYGFAGVAIGCLTGVAPWTGKDFKYIMGALFAGRTPPELELVADKSVRVFLGQCMVKDPTQRPTAGQVLTFCESQLALAEQIEEARVGSGRDLIEELRIIGDRIAIMEARSTEPSKLLNPL